MESETLRDIVSENRELEQKLTKRNEQYIFDLKKSLVAANLSEEAQTLALHEILPHLVEGQKSGKTARQLFGTVAERTESILNKPEELPESTPTLMWLDNTLLLFGVMSIMFSITMMWSKGKSQPLGLVTLILASMVGGYVFYLMFKYVWQYDRPGVDKAKRPSWIRIGLILVSAMFLWIVVFAGSAMLPPVVNPILDPIIVIIIGGIALGVRYLLKKKYNMRSSLVR
ncbi:DUF1129 domain-containing protein [Enterococcus ureasiticus]|uniref:DUF1129 domain-containing protein n=1 Tax=Enterococcus ureasiticus TaxID=903984 RepID=UPI001A8C6C25|nr:DUF1129 domain-containing protein [Enterococcus ureasiticus]MBO0473795.1 DUF1129 domain-containing protein [Enterococcus ureasiticus]